MLYFDHSTTATNDSKIMQLRLEEGGAAVDAYWYIIEQIHLCERPLCVRNASAMRVHMHALCTNNDTLEKWINSMISIGLLILEKDGESVTSERAKNNILAYKEKSQKNKKAADLRWKNASAMQTHSERNASAKRTQSKRNADAMPTKQNKTKGSNTTKGITTFIETGEAGAEKPAPPAQENYGYPKCKKDGCDGDLRANLKSHNYVCNTCGAAIPFDDIKTAS